MPTSPLAALGRGLLAGLAGTAAMTAYQLAVQRARAQGNGAKPRAWKDAPAPAQVAKRILTGVFQVPVGLERAGQLAHAMHWVYGTTCGAAYGLVQGTIERAPLAVGAGFGTGVWTASYGQLVPMGIYEPPWRYPPAELALDLSYHLVYGVATALAFEALTPSGR